MTFLHFTLKKKVNKLNWKEYDQNLKHEKGERGVGLLLKAKARQRKGHDQESSLVGE